MGAVVGATRQPPSREVWRRGATESGGVWSEASAERTIPSRVRGQHFALKRFCGWGGFDGGTPLGVGDGVEVGEGGEAGVLEVLGVCGLVGMGKVPVEEIFRRCNCGRSRREEGQVGDRQGGHCSGVGNGALPRPAPMALDPPDWRSEVWSDKRERNPRRQRRIAKAHCGTMILYEAEQRQFKQVCDQLCQDTQGRAILFIDANGQIIDHGPLGGIDTTAMASLTAGTIMASSGLAKLIGADDFPTHYYEGKSTHIYSVRHSW